MFFFIGGIQPRTIRIAKLSRFCPKCGSNSIYKKRVDHYISLFFIPILPVQKGRAFTVCENCQAVIDDAGGFGSRRAEVEPNRCSRCGVSVERNFNYCPNCGGRLSR